MPTFTAQSIREIVNGFQPSRVLLTAYELGVFTALGDAWRPSAEVATDLGTDARATDRLMNALVAMGLLEKRDGRFANGASAAKLLVRGGSDYMSGLMHSAHMWTRWSTLTEAVRRGTPVAPAQPRGEEWGEAFMAAMHWRGVQQAPEVAKAIGLDGVSRVLDVAGGTGVFSMAFARARAGLRAVVFDLPAIVPITRRYVADAGLSDRVTATPGDLTTDDFPGDFDLVFLSAIAHSFGPEENRRLVAKAARALAPGGRVVVQEFVIDEDRRGPLQPALFALNMLVGTRAGDTYAESEIRGWLTAAGLASVTRTDTRFGTSLIGGRKSIAD